LIALLSIVLFLCFLGLYAFICYVIYRIVRKFDPTVSYGENLIPFYNFYLLLKQAVSSPGVYFFVIVGCGIFGFIVDLISKGPHILYPDAWLLKIPLNLIDLVLMARIWGLIARKLGKSFWLYAIFSLVPIANPIIILVLAFGDSQPVPGVVSPSPGSSPPPLPPES
jgi:hypothetical protein